MTVHIFPINPLGRGLSVDPAFERVYNMVVEAGCPVGFVDHDKLTLTGEATVRFAKFTELDEDSEYHGWMMSKEHYQSLSNELTLLGSPLRTTPQQYAKAHYADGWTHELRGLIPETLLIPENKLDSIAYYSSLLYGNTFFLKDYVKSVEGHTKAVGVYGSNGVNSVAQRIIEERGESFAGGIVLREWVTIDSDAVEVRGWWRNGDFVALTPHPSTPGKVPELPTSILDKMSERLSDLELSFVTVDFMHTADGWTILEVGDGQVSEASSLVSDETLKKILEL